MFLAPALLSIAAEAGGRPHWHRLRRAGPVLAVILVLTLFFYACLLQVETAQQQVLMELPPVSSYTWYFADATLKETVSHGPRTQAGSAAGGGDHRGGQATTGRSGSASAGAQPSQGSGTASGSQGGQC